MKKDHEALLTAILEPILATVFDRAIKRSPVINKIDARFTSLESRLDDLERLLAALAKEIRELHHLKAAPPEAPPETTTTTEPRLLTPREVASFLRVSVDTVYKMVTEGRLDSIQTGVHDKTVRVEQDALLRYIDGRKRRAPVLREPSKKKRKPE